MKSERKILYVEHIQKWFEEFRFCVKDSSLGMYCGILENQIIPYLGDYTLSQLDDSVLGNYVDKIYSSGYSYNYKRDIFKVLKQTLVGTSCEKAINKLQKKQPPNFKKKEIRILKAHELSKINKYLNGLSHDGCSIAIILAMLTGIRIGEACALRYNDIDYDNNSIHVSATIQRIKNYDNPESGNKTILVLTSPKTPAAIRTIPIPAQISSKIKALNGNPEHFIISGSKKMTDPRHLRKRFAKIIKELEMEHVNFHALRHTFATGCIGCNMDYKTVSEILGHSSVTITVNFYFHTQLEHKKECVNMFYSKIKKCP